MKKHISILIPETAVLQAIADPRYLFTTVNQFLQSEGRPELFEVSLVGVSKEVHTNQGAFTIHCDKLLDEVKKTDLVIIPAINGDIKTALKLNEKFVPWIIDQYKGGAEVVSLCLGAFLLASTGLLDGKKCSTHWVLSNEFRNMFPDVTLVNDRIITEQNGLYTSGGANSYWNLLLYLIEKYTDRRLAILASKYFAIEIDRNSQSAFIMFRGQKEHEDEEVKKAQEFIEHNFHDRITVDQLSTQFAIGRRSLERRFKKVTSNTVVEYIQRVKIEAAKKGFESSRKTISEIMYEVGYTDTKAFRDVFKKITGMTPVEYRNKYHRLPMMA